MNSVTQFKILKQTKIHSWTESPMTFHIKEIKNRKKAVFSVYIYAVGNTDRVYSTFQPFQSKLLRQLETNIENIDSIPCLILTFLCLLHYFHLYLLLHIYIKDNSVTWWSAQVATESCHAIHDNPSTYSKICVRSTVHNREDAFVTKCVWSNVHEKQDAFVTKCVKVYCARHTRSIRHKICKVYGAHQRGCIRHKMCMV
jgi:hypothetical protein